MSTRARDGAKLYKSEMAGFVASPNTVRVLLHWTIHGRPQLNVLHGTITGAGPLDPNLQQNLFTAIAAALTSSNFKVSLATTTIFTGVGVIDLRFPANPEVISTGTAVPGTDATPALPDQVSLVVTLRTAKAGRSYRGRIYLMGLATDCMGTDGLIAAGVTGQAQAFVTAVMAAMSSNGVPLAIRSPALPVRPSHGGGELPAKDFALTPVTTAVIRDRIPDTNRRRTDLLRR